VAEDKQVAESGGRYDAFVSYGHADAEWAGVLADNLVRSGLDVWQDRYELTGGDLLAARLQDGLARSRAVVLVVSANSLGRGWVEEEFAAAVARVVAGTQRLVPVLLGDVALPPFVASRLWVDFRAVASPEEYLAKVAELVRVLHELPSSDRPMPGEALAIPAALVARAEGPLAAKLTIAADMVTFSTAEQSVEAAPAGADYALRDALYRLDGARARPAGSAVDPARPPGGPGGTGGLPVLRDDDSPGAAGGRGAGVSIALSRVGRMLGERFLPEQVATALADAVRRAQARNSALRLGIETSDEQLADLPWETLTVPTQTDPLVLSDRVEVYRTVSRLPGVEPPAVRIPGPLRVLAVIGSPDDSTGPLLDYETELRRILDAVDPARRGNAHVEVLQWGSLASINAALQRHRFHVLHVSCHAGPGVLQLEKRDGRVDEVTVERFVTDALSADRGVPLIVLAGCSTALTPRAVEVSDGRAPGGEPPPQEAPAAVENSEPDSATRQGRALAGFARGLVEHGVPAVLAMTAPVTDGYATALAAQTYGELAVAQRPDPLTALSRARRALEFRRRGATGPGGRNDAAERVAPWAEWATPTLVTAGPPAALFDRGEPMTTFDTAPEPVFDTAMVVRRVGDFVGRRAEQRRLLGALRGGTQHAGVLIHGIGGVGKSTLTAQLIHHLGADTGLLVPVSGTTPLSPDSILETLRARLHVFCIGEGLTEQHPLRKVSVSLMDAAPPWQDRLELIRQVVLSRVPITLLLDNAEDLLTAVERTDDGAATSFEFGNRDLADFLVAWIAAGDRARTVITSRVPITLPEQAERRLLTHHLGPLSLAETRKLTWRLPALDALSTAEQERAVAVVGGHPRTLEYLDALLAGGTARFADIESRLRHLLGRRGIDNPDGWLARQGTQGMDQALAEAVTLAVDDTVLGDLVNQLTPAAARLLTGLAVFQIPVDDIGVAWAHHGPTTVPKVDADLAQRLSGAHSILEKAAAESDKPRTAAEQGELQRTRAAYLADRALLRIPPVDPDQRDVAYALQQLTSLGLVAPAPGPDDEPGEAPTGWYVHRWTANTVAPPLTGDPEDRLLSSKVRTQQNALEEAHKRAAAYWTWRVRVWPQERMVAMTQLLQARRHHYAARNLDAALAVHDIVTTQLVAWGAWTWSRALHEETIDWVPPNSQGHAVALHQLGNLAQLRGDYTAAESYYRESLTISDQVGDRDGLAAGYHQLGMLAHNRGDYVTAEKNYRYALTIKEELGDRVAMASSFGQLGNLAQHRGDYDTAESYYRQSLTVNEALSDRVSTAKTYHNLGNLAELRGDYDTAENYYRQSLTIKEELGDRAGVSKTYHHFGILAQLRGDYDTAENYYRQSLTIDEGHGDRAGTAISYHQLGRLAELRRDYETADSYYQESLAIKKEIGDRAGVALTTSQLGVLECEQGSPHRAVGYQVSALAIYLELGVPDAHGALYWLARQREMLGEAEFKAALAEHLEPNDVTALLELLDQDNEATEGEDPGAEGD